MTDGLHQDIDPETRWSRAVIQLMERAIARAETVKPTAWVLFRRGDAVVLHIGKRHVSVMSPDSVELFVNVNTVDRMNLVSLVATTREMVNHWFPNDGKMVFPIEYAAEVVQLVGDNHLDAVSGISRIAAATDKRARHDECLRLKLNEVGGVNITSPEYTGYTQLQQLDCE